MSTPDDAAVLVADRYLLGQPLGRGGMGEVYRATDRVLGREVAIKFLLPVRETLASAERFEREARAAAMISDAHVVAGYDFGRHRNGYFLAMELVEGCTVSEHLRRNGPLDAGQAVEIIRQAAAGVAAAHAAGIIHRDLKPANLLLTESGQVKVADFGIVRFLDDTTTTLTTTGQIVGTSHYLSPERALGEPADRPSDVYALGCVLYQLVTGHPPFMGEEPASIMYQHVETAPVPPSDLRPELAGGVEALLFWMLAKDPAQRPTAAQVAQGATPPADPMSKTTIMTHPPRRPRKALAAAGSALTLLLALTVGLLLDADTTKLPTTNELRPESTRTTPAAKPSLPQPPPTSTSNRTTVTQSPKQTQNTNPPSRSGKQDGLESSKPDKNDRPATDKPKRPKKPKP
ncbi:protein kinase [Kribbella sp. NPDC056345]|uniref:serine/threonine protein kinase n=1 Tax=Kribbella sp. NPDC056345 TaxID=3345789 RepID=UPI0035D59F73